MLCVLKGKMQAHDARVVDGVEDAPLSLHVVRYFVLEHQLLLHNFECILTTYMQYNTCVCDGWRECAATRTGGAVLCKHHGGEASIPQALQQYKVG